MHHGEFLKISSAGRSSLSIVHFLLCPLIIFLLFSIWINDMESSVLFPNRNIFASPPCSSNVTSAAETLRHKAGKYVGCWGNAKSTFVDGKVATLQMGQSRLLFKRRSYFKVFSIHGREAVVLKARSIDEIHDALVERLLPVVETSEHTTSKYIVGLAGPPGAGKSTLANEVVRRLNMIWPQKASFDGLVETSNVATVVPMDGFHLYRSQLDAMENPDEAHARRGAPWTFDPVRLLACLTTLKEKGSVYLPSFDHGVGDPVEDDIFVDVKQKLVIVEGNYLLLDDGVWKDISRVFDEKWFIDIDIDKSMKRVLKRHIATGKAPDVAKWRVEYNDRPNAELIMKSKKNADLVICSVDFKQ